MPGGAPDQRHGDDEAEIAGDQAGADAAFQGTRLGAVVEILEMAHLSQRLVKQNFALAFTYNALTVPLAVLGLVTPLVAAICMSASSLAVIGNAFRLNLRAGRDDTP